MITFSVKNFDRFQHYKDRAPPWIKLYNELLDDYEFGALPDASKMHLVAIWLLASRSENKIPFDPEWVSRRINATEKVDLKLLAQKGFIVVDQQLQDREQDASTSLAERLPREEKRREETEDMGRASAPAKHEPERKSRKKPKQQIPDDYRFPDRVRQYGVKLGFSGSEIDREEQRFIRHAKQNARVCADWDMAAENWLDKAAEFAGKPPPVDAAKAAEALKNMHYAKAESPQLAAWDRHWKVVSGKAAPRDRNGGWYFNSEWPPDHTQAIAAETEMMS